MCEASAFIIREGNEELLLEGVDLVESKDNSVKIKTIFGEEQELKARVRSFSLVEHKIILEPL